MDLFTESAHVGATFSPCRTWRYGLWRIWQRNTSYCLFLMLNPSTATEYADDPTVAKCQRYARRWGYGGIYVCNLFAFRATDPRDMKHADDPIGPENNQFIVSKAVAADMGMIICAWGNHGTHLDRAAHVRDLLQRNGVPLHCLKQNANGEPAHPLYLKESLRPIPYEI
ncbi:MAG TPA: DUF1643 domain-containing protein [Gammaproteobacteria bacterium]|nr:DUF1643 domain-containing protein [Gammaproteobacteria bacterium]